MSNTNYGIDDADGNAMTTGLQECNAARVAQSMADRHNKTVYLYELGSDADPVAYEPLSIEFPADKAHAFVASTEAGYEHTCSVVGCGCLEHDEEHTGGAGIAPTDIVVSDTAPDCASDEPVIIASNPRASTYVEVPGAVDVDVTVDGVEGEVTLAPRQYDGGLAAYGTDPSMWVSGKLLASLTNGRSLREVLDAIEAAAVEVC